MESLGRYPLSVILSYLHEYEGTSLLITKKRYAYQLLPIFRVKTEAAWNELNVLDSPHHAVTRRKHRHMFAVCPVQDATVLLDRLNTRKLCRRKRPRDHIGCSTSDIAVREWLQDDEGSSLEQFPPNQLLLRFLSKYDRTSRNGAIFGTRGVTLLASYPRSGNSLARSLLERTTGIVTGSDTRPDRSLSRELAEQHKLVGEGIVQNVAFVKTHWPERQGAMTVKASRAILLVRNPYDAIDSYWNMNATKSHTKTLTEDVYERFRDVFEALVENEIKIWNRFNRYWMEEVDIPVLLVRFEDLIQNPVRQLTRMMCFALGEDQLSAYWESRIHHATGTSVDQLGSYRPRAAGTRESIGKSIRKGRFTQRLLRVIHETSDSFASASLLRRLGYDVLSAGFPDTMSSVEHFSDVLRGESLKNIVINEGQLVRPLSCSFGRALTAWRHSVTDGDKNPLPTASR